MKGPRVQTACLADDPKGKWLGWGLRFLFLRMGIGARISPLVDRRNEFMCSGVQLGQLGSAFGDLR